MYASLAHGLRVLTDLLLLFPVTGTGCSTASAYNKETELNLSHTLTNYPHVLPEYLHSFQQITKIHRSHLAFITQK